MEKEYDENTFAKLDLNTTTKVLLALMTEIAVFFGIVMAYMYINIDLFKEWAPFGENAYFLPLIMGFVIIFNMYYLMEKLADEQIGKIRDDY